MHKTKNELYKLVEDIISKKDFNKEITDFKNNNNDLFEEDTIALLLVDKLGRNKINNLKLSNLETGMEGTIFGKITFIGELKTFERKNGSTGEVVNIEISDDTGTSNLVLWDKDVEFIKNKKIKNGTNVKIINGFIKNGFNGLEINIGRWSLIEIEPESMPNYNNNLKIYVNEIKGILHNITPTRAFFKDNGNFGFVSNITIKTNEGLKQLVVWDDKVKELQNFKQGDKIKIKNFDIKEKNKIKEFHINGKGEVIKI